MKKQEHSSLYKALGIVGVLLAAVLIPFFVMRPAQHYADPLERALSLYQKGDYKQAATYFRQADSMGSSDAAFALGAMSFAGKGTTVNIPEALIYYEKAAKTGYAPAQTTLALIYVHGQNVAQDLEKGLDYAKQAAENGDVEAQMMLARWFETGENVDQDVEEAVKYYKMAAEAGSIDAKTALTLIYKNGAGNVSANEFSMRRWQNKIMRQKRFENIFQNLPPDHIEKIQP